MYRKLIRIIVGIVCFSFVLSGCSLPDFFSAENLIRPPKLTGEHAALQKAFEDAVGKDIGLFTPISGNHRGAYILFDANSDGIDEAVVFYSLNSNSSVIHMHLLSRDNEQWYSVADIIGSGTEVYKVDFYNIDSSNMLEISVIWSVEDSKREKTLSVYRISSLEQFGENSVTSIATIQIADYVCFDVDSDRNNEILYLFYNDSENIYSLSARLLDFNDTEDIFVPLSDISFNSSIASFDGIFYEVTGSDLRVYLECVSLDGDIFTEMLVYSKDKEALLIPESTGVSLYELSRRKNSVRCMDFNEDRLIDIPTVLASDESYIISERPEYMDVPLLIEWMTYADYSFYSVGKYYINESEAFAIKIDDLYDYYYFVYDSVNRITQVRLKSNADENNIIFSVSKQKEADGYQGILGEGFLGERDFSEYSIVITALGESLNFSEAYVKSLIKNL